MTPEPQRRRSAPRRAPRRTELPLGDEIQAWSKPVRPVEDLDSVARRYPRRKLSLSSERKPLEVYDTPERPKAFSMDSLEFFFLIAQYFREALPLRLILLLIACQRAGGQIRLTQGEMATVLDVPRAKINEALQEIMGHGIVFKVRRGIYQFNPPYSYRVAEFIPGTELVEADYVQVDQDRTIERIRRDESLPDLVRFPSLEHMREAIEELRKKRAEERAARRLARAQCAAPGGGISPVSTLKWSATNADGLLADLDLPPAAYRALLKLRARSEAGGRIAMDQATLGELLGLSRPSVNAALRELELAKLVKKVRNGVYQINPMLAGYNSPEDALDAVKAMPKADRLDSKTYVADYHRAVAAYQDQLAEQRKKRAAAAAAKKAAAARRRGALHAVG